MVVPRPLLLITRSNFTSRINPDRTGSMPASTGTKPLVTLHQIYLRKIGSRGQQIFRSLNQVSRNGYDQVNLTLPSLPWSFQVKWNAFRGKKLRYLASVFFG